MACDATPASHYELAPCSLKGLPRQHAYCLYFDFDFDFLSLQEYRREMLDDKRLTKIISTLVK